MSWSSNIILQLYCWYFTLLEHLLYHSTVWFRFKNIAWISLNYLHNNWFFKHVCVELIISNLLQIYSTCFHLRKLCHSLFLYCYSDFLCIVSESFQLLCVCILKLCIQGSNCWIDCKVIWFNIPAMTPVLQTVSWIVEFYYGKNNLT